jgi:hypothetical protein
MCTVLVGPPRLLQLVVGTVTAFALLQLLQAGLHVAHLAPWALLVLSWWPALQHQLLLLLLPPPLLLLFLVVMEMTCLEPCWHVLLLLLLLVVVVACLVSRR